MRTTPLKKNYKRVFQAGERIREIDLIRIGLFARTLAIQLFLRWTNQNRRQIHRENLSVKILIDGLDGFSGEIFDFKARFHRFEIFLDSPPEMIEIGKKGKRVALRIQ